MGLVYAKEEYPGIPLPNVNYDECEGSATREISLEGVRARVDRIHINGLARTKNDYIANVVQELFKAVDFQDVLLKAHTVRTKLIALGCFQNIAVFIDTSKGSKSSPEGLEVTFHVKELKRIVGGINTQVGENEGSLVIGLRAPNILGRGERCQGEVCYGSKNTNNFNVSFVKPFTDNANSIFSTSIYQTTSEWPSSGYREVDLGVLIDYGFNSKPLLRHNIQWDIAIRNLSVLTKGSSFAIREESGATLKSALKHILSVDMRDDIIFPSCGIFGQLSTEIAGIGGDVGFMKNDIVTQTNYSIAKDWVLQSNFRAGILNSFGNNWKLGIMDMYYLGGPLSIRGFRSRGVGPHSEGDALGSTWFWSSGLHLFLPLPFRPGKGGFGELFRTQVFLNYGTIGNFEGEDSFMTKACSNCRVAYGLGLTMRLGQMARIEINYCFPFRFLETDKTQPGVQFGLGMHFL